MNQAALKGTETRTIPSFDGLYSAAICDALDSLGYRSQAFTSQFFDMTRCGPLSGRCRTTLWEDVFDLDRHPYELELQAVDSCLEGDVIICAAGGSNRSGIWGELLTTAAMNSGAAGVVVHGAVRDLPMMAARKFPVFATGRSPYDSQHRQKVVAIDLVVEIDEVRVQPGDLIYADDDGIVVIPHQVEAEALTRARDKVSAENVTRDAIRGGMKAGEAYRTFGVL